MLEPLSIEEMDKTPIDPTAVYLYNESNNEPPTYATTYSSGMDLPAWIPGVQEKFLFNAELKDDTVIIHPGGRALIPSGMHFGIPQGLEFQVRSRSGLALKKGIHVLNGIGTIDADYTGDVGAILHNAGTEDFVIHNGDRMAQLVLMPVLKVIKFAKADRLEDLPKTNRGQGGYGHTGI